MGTSDLKLGSEGSARVGQPGVHAAGGTLRRQVALPHPLPCTRQSAIPLSRMCGSQCWPGCSCMSHRHVSCSSAPHDRHTPRRPPRLQLHHFYRNGNTSISLIALLPLPLVIVVQVDWQRAAKPHRPRRLVQAAHHWQQPHAGRRRLTHQPAVSRVALQNEGNSGGGAPVQSVGGAGGRNHARMCQPGAACQAAAPCLGAQATQLQAVWRSQIASEPRSTWWQGAQAEQSLRSTANTSAAEAPALARAVSSRTWRCARSDTASGNMATRPAPCSGRHPGGRAKGERGSE